ncbi:RTA1-domain-containing protein [Saccharata proteae CBS 121410]|uniref:RTA1-domain-containing protein n=1 Tax=Saccharata proteae CBS 121410 TaxID=1314787 RepID=A0A9P4HQ47_9PEZI|nr:RTA1-domain-containing protein [Saccharata proteae CBS 121410]
MNNYRKGCTAYMPQVQTSYGYVPHLSAGIVFVVLFSLTMSGHIVQAGRKRVWTSYCCTIGALVELMGWAGRTWSSQCPYNDSAFLMQITTLIIAPTFFSAAAYVILGSLIKMVGRSSSILSPTMYLAIFCSCDGVSLIVQAVGGALASIAQHKGTSTATGTHIMVAGILFQMASMTVFVFFLCDFLRRVNIKSLPKGAKIVLPAMVFSVVTIYIRSIYRTIELLQGWRGFLITHEKYFIALDAAMMVLASGVYNILDPAFLLPSLKDKGAGGSRDGD